MAKTVTQSFTDFKANLEITTLQSSTASTRQTNLRKNLEKEMTVEDSFLVGSYQRSTMISPLSSADVDVMVVLDSKYKKYEDGAQAKLLDQVKKAVAKSYSESTGISRNGQAVTITFSDFRVDVVPAFKPSWSTTYSIPDSIGKRWIDTDPKKHISLWSESNKANDYMLVPLIKMLKAWNRAHSEYLRSFHLEAMARQVFLYSKITNYPDAALKFFTDAQFHVTHLSDPANTSGNLATYLASSSSSTTAVTDRLKAAKAKAEDAIKLNKDGKNEQAINKWRVIFGDYHFPKYG